MKVEYCIDPEWDAFTTWQLIKSNDPAKDNSRAKEMGFSEKELKRIQLAEVFDDVIGFLPPLLQEKLENQQEKVDYALENYQKEWNKINDTFFNKTREITGSDWNYDIYYVVLSPINRGISSRGEDTVIRWIHDDPKEQLRITAHELLMSHIWNVLLCKHPDAQKDGNMFYWAFNEITTTAVLGLEPELNDLWTEETQGFDQFLSNYPQLTKLKMKLKGIYLSNSNFEEYKTQAIDLIKKASSRL
jgi:hypothetical protein